MMGRLPWVLAGLATAGIIHIITVFAIPVLAERDAWARLSAVMKPNTLAIADGQHAPRLPFTSPDVATAYCLFDISKDNVIVRSALLEAAWSVALSSRSGENFYLITGADVRKPEVRLLIIPQDRLPEEVSTEKTEEGGEQNIIVSPGTTGIVAIRATLRGESFRAQVQDELSKARCEVQKRLEPPVVAVAEPEAAAPAEEEKPQPHARGKAATDGALRPGRTSRLGIALRELLPSRLSGILFRPALIPAAKSSGAFASMARHP